jgi:hypothetical protein
MDVSMEPAMVPAVGRHEALHPLPAREHDGPPPHMHEVPGADAALPL